MTYPSPGLFPSTTLYPSGTSLPSGGGDGTDTPAPPPVSLPSATSASAPVSEVLVHVGEFLTGRITATIPVTSASWTDVLNDSGSIQATVAEEVVRSFDLRQLTNGVRSFLAVERDGRIRQAGPIWSRTWDWEAGQLTLGAGGLWSWLDKRVIIPETILFPPQKNAFTVTGKSLGGIARGLVEFATMFGGATGVPIVLPDDEAGTHTESFPRWAVLWYGDQLRQITQRATDAPDIAFEPRRRTDDPRFIEWVMRVGTETEPALSQGGAEWVFDSSVMRSDTFGIATDEDATGMAPQVWVTGNGQEESILMSVDSDSTLILAGYPLTNVSESFPTVEDQATLDGHAASLLARSSRPVEVFKVSVSAELAREVRPGDYTRLITRGDAWLGDMNRQMRVKSVSGDLSDTVKLEMFPMAAFL